MKPFLLGRKTHEEAALRPAVVTSALPIRGHQHAAAEPEASASIEVIKDGDKVMRLVVTCSCGERIEVNCLYPAHG